MAHPRAGQPRSTGSSAHEDTGFWTGYTYLRSAIDGYSRLAYTEALSDEKAATATEFLGRAREWFATHGITHIERIVTDGTAT